MLVRNILAGCIAASFLSLASLPALAEESQSQESQTNVMFIFDASGSMKRAAGSEPRIIAAKRAFSETLSSMPAGVRTGLIAFGHRRAKDCGDIEVVSPIGADEAKVQGRMVEGLEALGETPIAASIERAGQALRAFKGQKNSIVLVTDGIEECRGDPCAAAAALKDLGIDVKVHVVGFALGAGESSKLQCVVQQTGGTYFDAADVTALRRQLAEVRTIVAQAPAPKPVVQVPPPPQPARTGKTVFTEDFSGTDISGENWQIINENKDRYIVEKGSLMVAGPTEAAFHDKSTNIFMLKPDMPDGDWDVVIDARLNMQTGRDEARFGFRTDGNSFMYFRVFSEQGNPCFRHKVGIGRVSGGEVTKADKFISGGGSCGDGDAFGPEDQLAFRKTLLDNGIRLTISKRDRKYFGTFEVKDWKDAKGRDRKVVTDELTSIRSPGHLAIQVGKHDPARQGETIVFIDDIKVISLE